MQQARFIGELIDRSVEVLSSEGLEEARRDALLLLAHVMSTEPWRLLLDPESEVSPEVLVPFQQLLERRSRHEPIAYLLGFREFWSKPFRVGPGVLVPRPETEGLIDAALSRSLSGPTLAADIGTGSGCIAISLASELAEAHVVATDTSQAALEIARENIETHRLSDRIELREGSGLSALAGLEKRLDLILSNPPYVSEMEWAGLDPEVREWEPRRALVPGPTGLEMLRDLCEEADRFLKPSGWLLMEVGEGQAEPVCQILGNRWRVEVEADLAGIDRIVAATPAESTEEN